jgi:N-methylhydantoinase B
MIMSFHSGGTGARPGKDGLSATAFPSGVKNVPVEVTESVSSLLIRRKEYRVDSGGPGVSRGGLGQVMVVENRDPAPFSFNANYDRIGHPPRGRDGGGDGLAGAVRLTSGATLRGKGQQTVPRGDRVVIEMPGGGGLGDPRQRPVERVLADVRAGLVSREAAARDYGVVIAADGALDRAATEARRSAAAD